MSPKVSVIIPAYNAEPFIERAIRSVLAQRGVAAIEILVVDDRSSDRTAEIVGQLAARHPQIIGLRNERRSGPSGARNTGLLKARGEYIAFLDADDLWLPGHLATGIGFLEKHAEIDAIFFNFDVVRFETGEKIGDWFSRHSFARRTGVVDLGDGYFLLAGNLFAALIEESFIHLQSLVMRRDILGQVRFNEEISRSEDRDFCIHLYRQENARFAFKDLVTGIYFRHPRSLTSDSMENQLQLILDHIRLFSGYLADCRGDDAAAVRLREILYRKHLSASYCYRKLQQYGQAATMLGRSFRYRLEPDQFKELAKIAAAFVSGGAAPRRGGAT